MFDDFRRKKLVNNRVELQFGGAVICVREMGEINGSALVVLVTCLTEATIPDWLWLRNSSTTASQESYLL